MIWDCCSQVSLFCPPACVSGCCTVFCSIFDHVINRCSEYWFLTFKNQSEFIENRIAVHMWIDFFFFPLLVYDVIFLKQKWIRFIYPPGFCNHHNSNILRENSLKWCVRDALHSIFTLWSPEIHQIENPSSCHGV